MNAMNSNAATATAPMGERRAAAPAKAESGLGVKELALVAVLLAAGAVLKLTVSSFFSFAGMKPNFIIAMYCLAIILIRPKLAHAAVIGLLAGLICQLPMLNATPYVNIASELAGALVCGMLAPVAMKLGSKADLGPAVCTFVSTAVSGYTFAFIVGAGLLGLDAAAVAVAYAPMVLGTAAVNTVLVSVLAVPMRKAMGR